MSFKCHQEALSLNPITNICWWWSWRWRMSLNPASNICREWWWWPQLWQQWWRRRRWWWWCAQSILHIGETVFLFDWASSKSQRGYLRPQSIHESKKPLPEIWKQWSNNNCQGFRTGIAAQIYENDSVELLRPCARESKPNEDEVTELSTVLQLYEEMRMIQ